MTLDTDGWSLHQASPTEGGDVFVRGLASSIAGGMVTVDIGGTQGHLLSAIFPVASAPQAAIPPTSFTPFARVAPVARAPAFKWFNGLTFNGPMGADATTGFANGYHGLLLETTNGGRTWTDLTDPSSNAALQADIASIAISPSLGAGAPIAVAGSLSPAARFPSLHFATQARTDISWHISTTIATPRCRRSRTPPAISWSRLASSRPTSTRRVIQSFTATIRDARFNPSPT